MGQPYLLAHTTRRVQAIVKGVDYRVDVDTLHRDPASTLAMNEIGRARLGAATGQSGGNIMACNATTPAVRLPPDQYVLAV